MLRKMFRGSDEYNMLRTKFALCTLKSVVQTHLSPITQYIPFVQHQFPIEKKAYTMYVMTQTLRAPAAREPRNEGCYYWTLLHNQPSRVNRLHSHLDEFPDFSTWFLGFIRVP
jgi:hypothetical protein